jgi:CRISPR/Cas system CSM-associated protein Csm3 (group 7 of RAMP superfamily)
MRKIKYRIEMLSDWHIGSGLDGGADADLLVLKDENNLPYIPGKTIKGLLKDSLMDIADLEHKNGVKKRIESLFGKEVVENKKIVGSEPGTLFFSNAEINSAERNDIISNNLSSQLYKNIASTQIDDKGIAKKSSLRTMQVCIPVSLEGEISGEEIDDALFEMAFKWTRQLGVNRNRGLGRCKISIIKD